MNHFTVNGVERPMPETQELSLGDLIQHVHQTYSNDKVVVSAIRVNGVELEATDEQQLATIPVSDLESLEVTMCHPREMAEETLQILKVYSDRLIQLSRENGAQPEMEAHHPQFLKLMDGIQTFVESIQSVKGVLRIQAHPVVDGLEDSLTAILTDLLAAQREGNTAMKCRVLKDRLPENLAAWKTSGIPSLIRSRDS